MKNVNCKLVVAVIFCPNSVFKKVYIKWTAEDFRVDKLSLHIGTVAGPVDE
jgi:hypothetical protein